MSDCIFCKLLAGELPMSLVFQDEYCFATLDIDPINPGHVLVIPKRHAASLAELDDVTGAHMFNAARTVAAAMRKATAIKCEGVNLFLADGAVAGQDVFHAHLHIRPRYAGDEVRSQYPAGFEKRPKPNRETLDSLAASIKCHL